MKPIWLLFKYSCIICFIAFPLHAQTPDSSKKNIVEHEFSLAETRTGPHQGLGTSTAYVFFKNVKGFPLSFQKHVLHPGATVGKHIQPRDEVYYVVDGTGTMMINDEPFPVNPGDVILTRTGSTHALIQTGEQPLIIIVTYKKDE